MADKNITLHPLNSDGSIKTDENLYPKTKVEQVIGLENEYVSSSYAEENFVKKSDTEFESISFLNNGQEKMTLSGTEDGLEINSSHSGSTFVVSLYDETKIMSGEWLGSDFVGSELSVSNNEIFISCSPSTSDFHSGWASSFSVTGDEIAYESSLFGDDGDKLKRGKVSIREGQIYIGSSDNQSGKETNLFIDNGFYLDSTESFRVDAKAYFYQDFYAGTYDEDFGSFFKIFTDYLTSNTEYCVIGNVGGVEIIRVEVPLNSPNNGIAYYKGSEIANKGYVDSKNFEHHQMTIRCVKDDDPSFTCVLYLQIDLRYTTEISEPEDFISLGSLLDYRVVTRMDTNGNYDIVSILDGIKNNDDYILEMSDDTYLKITSITDNIRHES